MKYIYGLNKSGQSIISYLDKIGENYYCWDDDSEVRKKLIKSNNKIKLIEPKKLNLKLIDESFISPGISLTNKKINFLNKKTIKLYRDLELYSRISKEKKTIAVTGTNGKSTTSKLISDLLSIDSIENFLGGNIGIPLLDFYNESKEIIFHVIELSSFQLESTVSFNPYISILLNIYPDHLDRYKSFKDYSFQKEKILNLNKQGNNIVCINDKKTLEIYDKYKNKVIPISNKVIKKGIYFEDNKIIDNFFGSEIKIYLKDISPSLFGSFNMDNILSAYVVSKILGIKIDKFLLTVKNFKGLPHRLENIYKNNFFQVINNSKATNLDACIKSILNFNNINLIMGGKAKEKKFMKILKYKSRINKIYLIGESAEFIFNQLKNEVNCEIFECLELAIDTMFLDIKNLKKYQTILFSPACTSFDQFNNFEERGNFFKKIINKKTY